MAEPIPDEGRVSLATLSSRELEVLGMVAHGLTNSGAAAELGITVHAVKFHLASIYRKLGVSNRTEAAFALLTTASDTTPRGR